MGNSLNFSVTFECSTKVNYIVNIQCFIANQRDGRESFELTMKVLRVLPYGFCGGPLELFEKMKGEEFELEENEKLYYVLYFFRCKLYYILMNSFMLECIFIYE